MCGNIHIPASFQAAFVTAQPDSAAEKLDCLGTFAFGEVDQAHRGNAPAVPAFSELARADENIDCRILAVDVPEKRLCDEFLASGNDAVLFTEFGQRFRISDADDAEIFSIIADFEGNFSGNLAQVFHMQPRFIGNGFRVEQQTEHIGIYCRCIEVIGPEEFLQRPESLEKQFIAVTVDQAGVIMKQGIDPGNCFRFVPQEFIKEAQNLLDVRQLGGRRGSRDPVADKNQQRLFDQVRLEFVSAAQKDL